MPTHRPRHARRRHTAWRAGLFPALLLSLTSPRAHAADEIHWTMTSPTSVTVDWRGPTRVIRYGLTRAYTQFVLARPPGLEPISSPGPFWEAKIEGLEPGTTYHYSIEGGPDHTFHGTPVAGQRFTVYVEADVGSSLNYANVLPVQKQIAAGSPSFVLVAGDLSYAADSTLAAVDRHFNDVMVWSQDAAYMPIWGNHDWDQGDSPDNLLDYKSRFDLPNERSSPGAPLVSCCGKDWYWFDAGYVRFIAYPEPFPNAWNTWFEGAQQLMDQAQADHRIQFIVTFGHRPAYSSGHHAGDPKLRAMLDSLGARHPKYVLNLNGHSHDYERSYPMSGVTHVTVGIGGSTLEQGSGACLWSGGCPAPAWSAMRAYHHGALRLDFSPYGIHGAVMCGPPSRQDDMACVAGDAFDTFDIGGDSPPVITGVPGNLSVGLDQVFVVDVSASDPNGEPIDSLSADLSEMPRSSTATFTASADHHTGRLSWTPGPTDIGSHEITFRASNALVGMATMVVDVKAVLGAPTPGGPTLALDGPRPNPAASRLTLSYSTADGETPRFELVDVAGRVVDHVDRAPLDPGRHVLSWAKPAGLPAGIYWLRLRQSGRTVTRSVVFRP